MHNCCITILLIEDNPVGAYVFDDLIYSMIGDYQLIWKRNLHDAIHEMNRFSWDVIVLNLNLPDSKGYQTFDALKTRCPEVPIVVVHDGNDSDLRERIIRSGTSAYIVEEEINEQSLIQLVRRVFHLPINSSERN